MQWIVAIVILLLGLAGLFLLVSTGRTTRRNSAAASFVTGMAETFDPTAAMIALENEKRANIQGEKEDADPPEPGQPPR